MFLSPYSVQQFSWLLEKVYSLCALHALFPFPSCKTHRSLKRQSVVHDNLHTLHLCIHSLFVVWISFTTLPTHLTSSANVFVMSEFLTPEAPQRNWYKLFYPFYRITNPDFFWYFWFIKGQYQRVSVYYFIVSSDGDSLIFLNTPLLKCHFNFFWCC